MQCRAFRSSDEYITIYIQIIVLRVRCLVGYNFAGVQPQASGITLFYVSMIRRFYGVVIFVGDVCMLFLDTTLTIATWVLFAISILATIIGFRWYPWVILLMPMAYLAHAQNKINGFLYYRMLELSGPDVDWTDQGLRHLVPADRVISGYQSYYLFFLMFAYFFILLPFLVNFFEPIVDKLTDKEIQYIRNFVRDVNVLGRALAQMLWNFIVFVLTIPYQYIRRGKQNTTHDQALEIHEGDTNRDAQVAHKQKAVEQEHKKTNSQDTLSRVATHTAQSKVATTVAVAKNQNERVGPTQNVVGNPGLKKRTQFALQEKKDIIQKLYEQDVFDASERNKILVFLQICEQARSNKGTPVTVALPDTEYNRYDVKKRKRVPVTWDEKLYILRELYDDKVLLDDEYDVIIREFVH